MIFCICRIVGISVLMLFCFSACELVFGPRKTRTFEEAFKINWGIDLPENMKIEFSKSEAGRDGLRYSVLKAETEPTEFIADFSIERDEGLENRENLLISKAEFKVPESFLPDWEAVYYWKHTGKGYSKSRIYWDNLYMLYFPGSLTFIILQDFV